METVMLPDHVGLVSGSVGHEINGIVDVVIEAI